MSQAQSPTRGNGPVTSTATANLKPKAVLWPAWAIVPIDFLELDDFDARGNPIPSRCVVPLLHSTVVPDEERGS